MILLTTGSDSEWGYDITIAEMVHSLGYPYGENEIAKKILLPMTSAADIGNVPAELFAKFHTSFYTSSEDAVFKVLGLE